MSDQENNQVLVKWNELKLFIESLERDVEKGAHGVAAASTRARKGLRQLQTLAKDIVKTSLEATKEAIKEKKDQ